MQTVTSITDLKEILRTCRQNGKSIGLVPTMGNLHEGHLALINTARLKSDFVIATIFVNPLQFSDNEDLDQYPHTPEDDQSKLEKASCDVLFTPSVKDMYPQGIENQTTVSVPSLTSLHCGVSRPGHFEGVATVVSKLFNLIPADMAFFGEKDFQQLLIIRKLASDLCFDIAIHSVPTSREDSGLALSSRNHYLSLEEKLEAARLSQCLAACKQRILSGERDYRTIEKQAKVELSTALITVDYLNICNANSLEPAQPDTEALVILSAIVINSTRLIDNISLLAH